MMGEPVPVWVIYWRYSDGSAMGIVGAYGSERLATFIYQMLCDNNDGTRQFVVHRTDLFPSELTDTFGL